jgi:type IV pilus assembly protein PilY1
VALFGNGYNSSEQDGLPSDPDAPGRAVLYVVDVGTGALIKTLATDSLTDPLGASRPNGLSTVAPIDENSDYIADYVYGGDLYGNLWKFDLRDASADNWSLTGPLFSTPVQTVAGVKKGQPITTRPQVIRHPEGKGFLVLFGTGSYFQVGEGVQTNEATQAFYAIWDNPDAKTALVKLSDLQQQFILAEQEDDESGFTYRITSDYTIDWETKRGWYMNLLPQKLANGSANTNNFGERQVSDSIVRGGRLIFATLIPDTDACGFGGDGWLMEVDARTGSRELPNDSPFLFFKNGVYEMVNVGYGVDDKGNPKSVAPSGRKSQVGIIPAPAILARPGGTREYKYLSGSKANEATGLNLEVVVETAASTSVGRRSWSQLFK